MKKKVTLQWIITILTAIPTAYIVWKTPFWPLWVGSAFLVFGIAATLREQTTWTEHGVVQVGLLATAFIGLGLQGALTL